MGIIVQLARILLCEGRDAGPNPVDPPWRVGEEVSRLVEAEETPVRFWYSPFYQRIIF